MNQLTNCHIPCLYVEADLNIGLAEVKLTMFNRAIDTFKRLTGALRHLNIDCVCMMVRGQGI